MGHTGKSSGDIQRSSEKTTKYSDVDNRKTPMSEEDARQVTEIMPYFQSSNSFTINRILREMDDDATLESAFTGWWERNLKTVEAMDRNMLPLNKDIQVARMAADEFYENMMRGGGFSERDIDRAKWGDQAVIDRMNAKLAGTVVTEKQFLSTSWDTHKFDSAFIDRPLKVNFTAKAGTHAMFNPTKIEWDNESEMVLARGGSYKFLKFYYEDGKLQAKAETIPQTKVRRKR